MFVVFKGIISEGFFFFDLVLFSWIRSLFLFVDGKMRVMEYS